MKNNILATTSIEELVAVENDLHWDGNGSKQHYEGVVKELLERDMDYNEIINEVEKGIIRDIRIARLLERFLNKMNSESTIDLEISDEEIKTFKEINFSDYNINLSYKIEGNIIHINFIEE